MFRSRRNRKRLTEAIEVERRRLGIMGATGPFFIKDVVACIIFDTRPESTKVGWIEARLAWPNENDEVEVTSFVEFIEEC